MIYDVSEDGSFANIEFHNVFDLNGPFYRKIVTVTSHQITGVGVQSNDVIVTIDNGQTLRLYFPRDFVKVNPRTAIRKAAATGANATVPNSPLALAETSDGAYSIVGGFANANSPIALVNNSTNSVQALNYPGQSCLAVAVGDDNKTVLAAMGPLGQSNNIIHLFTLANGTLTDTGKSLTVGAGAVNLPKLRIAPGSHSAVAMVVANDGTYATQLISFSLPGMVQTGNIAASTYGCGLAIKPDGTEVFAFDRHQGASSDQLEGFSFNATTGAFGSSTAVLTISPISVFDGQFNLDPLAITPDGADLVAVEQNFDNILSGPRVSLWNSSTGTFVSAIAVTGTPSIVATEEGPVITGPPAKATVMLSGLTHAYTGAPLPVTVTTNPAGITTSVTYSSATYPASTTAPTNVGSYAVTATITDPNYTGSAKGTLVISKGVATVMLSNLTATYDGDPHGTTVVTNPSGLAVTTTYAGKTALPVNAGSYAVVATVTDPNHTGSGKGTLVISKETPSITLGDLSATYTGKAIAATATTSPVALAVKFAYTFNGKAATPINAGTYAVTATVDTANAAGSKSGTLTISPASATVTVTGATLVYTGKPIAATATTVPAKLPVRFTYQPMGGSPASTAPTAVGTYTVVGTVTNPNYSGSGTGTLTIKPPAPLAATAAATLIKAMSVTLNGTVNPKGVDTTVKFQYGTTTAYAGGTTASQDIGSGTVNKAVSAAISGLAPATTYHYRVVASSAGGVVDGLDKTFKTPAQAAIPLAKAATKAAATAVVGESVLRQGDVAPGLGGAVFSSFSDPASDETGGFAFVATLKQGVGGITRRNDAGLWASDANADLRLIAQTGEAAPGCPAGAVFISFDTFALADKGVVFVATINGGGTTAADDTGIWFADADGNVQLLARTGDVLEGKTVTGVDLGVSSDGNEVVAKVSFRDGSDAALDVESP